MKKLFLVFAFILSMTTYSFAQDKADTQAKCMSDIELSMIVDKFHFDLDKITSTLSKPEKLVEVYKSVVNGEKVIMYVEETTGTEKCILLTILQ